MNRSIQKNHACTYNRLNKIILFTLSLLLIIQFPLLTYSKELKLYKKGTEDFIDYSQYGKFINLGTKKYKYVVKKRGKLIEACGEGIYPNTTVFQDPEYKRLVKEEKLEGSQWDFVNTKDHILNFYKWASTQEAPGVKQYYIGLMFERMGMLKEAIKAYQAVTVHFPKETSFTYWDSPIYMGPICVDKIEILCRRNPELGLKLVDAQITVENGFDLDTKNDKFIINPGKLIQVDPANAVEIKKKFNEKEIVKSIGGKEVNLVKYSNGHWQLLVDSKPYIIKAIAYSPNKTGLSPDRGTLDATRDWQKQDFNTNSIHDGFYEAWIDTNRNNQQDPGEETVGDAKLLYDMGCNTLRMYSHVVNKELFRELYKKYKFRLMIGDLLGGYAVESGATWKDGTDYKNETQRERMLDNVKKMVLEYKDEPYTLIWVLGNENVYGVGNNSGEEPEAFFSLVNEAAKLIHELDPDHPVAVCNGDLKFLDKIAQFAPEIDILGANAYRGFFGFGRSMFQTPLDMMDKPVIITEYGCSAIAEGCEEEEAFTFQAEYHKNNWEDITFNSAGSGAGNALGGVIFEWVDEWWKANSDLPKKIQLQRKEWYAERSATYKSLQPENHDRVPQFGAPFLDGWSYEEWYGLFSQGDGKHSPFLRQKRPVYDMYKKLWNEK